MVDEGGCGGWIVNQLATATITACSVTRTELMIYRDALRGDWSYSMTQ